MPNFVHENATVIAGNDEQAGTTILFVVKRDSAVVFTFPMGAGDCRVLSAAEIELFLQATAKSDMLTAIKSAWEKRKIQ